MTQPSGATPTDTTSTATVDEDAVAQQLLADATSATTTTEPEGADKLGDAGKKALDAMKADRNAAKKELAAALAKLKEFEDRDKSDADKTAERLAAAEKTAAEATARLLRLEVAAAKGLTAGQAKRLVGATRDELEADADEMLADLGTTAAATADRPAAPRPDPSQGARGPAPAKRAGSLREAIDRHYRPAG